MLMTLGLAFVVRYGIQLIWGTQPGAWTST
jgi:hypothetical protein